MCMCIANGRMFIVRFPNGRMCIVRFPNGLCALFGSQTVACALVGSQTVTCALFGSQTVVYALFGAQTVVCALFCMPTVGCAVCCVQRSHVQRTADTRRDHVCNVVKPRCSFLSPHAHTHSRLSALSLFSLIPTTRFVETRHLHGGGVEWRRLR